MTELEKLSIDKFEQKQNLQIGRIFNIISSVFDTQNPASANNSVEVIYVASHQIPEDIIKYYYKVLNLIGITNPSKRVHFLVPDRNEEFPPHISIASKLLYSKNTLKRIKDIVNGRYCTIVSGAPSNDDVKLALNLGYPLMNGDPGLSINLMG